eukprot:960150-Pelagomonas_calceolata.AAC.2
MVPSTGAWTLGGYVRPPSYGNGPPAFWLLCAIDTHAGKFMLRHTSLSCAVANFLLLQNMKLFFFMSVFLDLLWAGVDQPQIDQPNSLAEGLPLYQPG